MYPGSTWKTLLVLSFLVAQRSALPAQKTDDAARFDAVITRFAESGQKDSFLFYSGEKLRLARQANNLALWGWTQFDIHYFFSDDPEQALSHLQSAQTERWREPAGAEEWEPFLYTTATTGWYLFQTGRIWQAVQAYENAAQIYEQFRYADFEAVEMVYKPLGNQYTRLGDNEKALAVFQKALLLGGDHETLSGLYGNEGIAYWNQGDFRNAELSLRKGLALPGISGAKRGLLLGALAQSQIDNGDIARAYTTATASLRILNASTGNAPYIKEYRVYSRRTAGVAAMLLGRYAAAGKLLREAREEAPAVFGRFSREVGKIEIARSNLMRLQGRYEAALDDANRALSAVLPGYRPKKPGDNPKASAFYEEITISEALEVKAMAAERWYEKNGDPTLLILALDCYDLAWQSETSLRQVYQYSSSKLNLQKSARTRDEAAIRVARLLYEKTGQQPYLEKAFAIAERSKATLLLDAVQDNLVRQRLAANDPRFGQIAGLRRNLAYFQRSMILDPQNREAAQWRMEADAITGRIAAAERAVSADYPGLQSLKTTAENTLRTPDEWADGETFVEYFVSDDAIEVFIFQKNKPPVWQRLPHDAGLKALYRKFTSFFASADAILNDPAGYLETAHALWQQILPAAAGGTGKLVIASDGFLNFIPFEALVTVGQASGQTLRNADYLIRKQEVRYVWSLAVWKKQHALAAATGNYLLAVSPGFAGGERGLAPLSSGRQEWSPVGDRNVKMLEGAGASLKNFVAEAGQYRILHFSTHAFADTVPRIELYDRPMFLPDIYATPLHADLVVLSACQTGLGFEQKGEGVMSLARAFAQSGAAGTVSSLWAVNDKSTVRVLGRFYGHLRDGCTLSDALRRAKLEYLNDAAIGATFQTPYFWAGFTAVGDDRKISGGGTLFWVFWVGGGIFLIGLVIILHQYFAHNQHFQWKKR